MNGDINFSDFNKIQVENKSKCKKFTNKFTFFWIFFILIIIIFIILFIYNNKEYNKKSIELSKTIKELNEIKLNLSSIKNKTTVAESTLESINNKISINTTETQKIIAEYTNLENKRDRLKYNKNDLLALKEYIENQIIYKKKSLNEDDLKLEIQKKQQLLKNLKRRFEDLSISNSNILINYEYFESFTETEILNKCYDSEVYGFHVNKFHENCDGYPLLILIKTKNGEKIGAFTSKSNDGIRNVIDEQSVLINFDKNKYFMNNLNENNKCFVYCDVNEFPRFGNDLIIYRNGIGESNFPECYDIIGENVDGEFIGKKFNIDIMEIYAVRLKNIPNY